MLFYIVPIVNCCDTGNQYLFIQSTKKVQEGSSCRLPLTMEHPLYGDPTIEKTKVCFKSLFIYQLMILNLLLSIISVIISIIQVLNLNVLIKYCFLYLKSQ